MSSYEKYHVEVQYTAGTWTDISTDVDTVIGPITASTGEDAESTGNPASLGLVLRNVGLKYTPGNTSSSFALSTGMLIRYFDVVGYSRAPIFTGFIEFPEIAAVNVSMNQDQTIQVSAVDQLSLWERSETYVSTLGAHIMGSASAPFLALYYPFNDGQQPFKPVIGSGDLRFKPYGLASPYTAPADTVQAASADGPPGDDVQCPVLSCPYFDPPTPIAGRIVEPHAKANISVHVGSTDTLALSAWVKPLPLISQLSPDLQNSSFLSISEDGGAPAFFGTHGVLFFDALDSTGQAYFQENPNITILNIGRPYPRDTWRLVTARITLSTGSCTLWVGSDLTASGTLTGWPSSYDFLYLDVGAGYFGSLAHIQVYVGANAFTYADHLAQFTVGMTGLARQTTGARIRTLAGYAGKTASELGLVDDGCSAMAAARLAGKTVAEAMYEARDTEQGDLYIEGSGLPLFADRRRLLNI